MACNAWNHPARCNCGWGGVNYGGGGGGGSQPSIWLQNVLAAQTQVEERRLVEHERNRSLVRSFITPNASCPICGDRVWFYASPHGGRVYFDEIGWPWPKHPCLDQGSGRGERDASPSNRLGLQEVGTLAASVNNPSREVPSFPSVDDDFSERQWNWQSNAARPVLHAHSEIRSSDSNILKAFVTATVTVGNPIESMKLAWPAMTTIDWSLPAFLSPIEEDNSIFEFHTFRWVKGEAEPKRFLIAREGPDVLGRIDRANAKLELIRAQADATDRDQDIARG